MEVKKIMLISSVGGHLEQLLSLNDVIESYDSYIVTEKNHSTINLMDHYSNIHFIPYVSRKSIGNFLLNSIKGFFISINLYRKIKPDIIITTGAGGVLSMFLIGKLFGSKLIFIETFSRIKSKTLTGRICYYIADVFIVQWPEMRKKYPNSTYFGHIY